MRHFSFHFRFGIGLAPALCAIIIVVGCGAGRCGETETVVARINGHPVTASRLQDELRRQKVIPRSPAEDEQNKLHALDSLITGLAIRSKAESLDLSRDHLLIRSMRQVAIQEAMQAYIQEAVAPKIAVTEEDTDTYWREHPEQFTTQQEQIHPQIIMIKADMKDLARREFPAEYDGWDAEEITNDLYRRLLAGEDLDTLALRYSHDVFSRARGGRLGWQYYDSATATPYIDSLFSFPDGKIMPPFFSDGAYFIVRINDRRAAGEVIVPDTMMRRQIAKSIGQERFNKWHETFIESLLTAGHLETFDTTLLMPINDLPPDLPIAVSNHVDTIYSDEFVNQSRIFRAADGTKNLQLEDKKRLLGFLHQFHLEWLAMKDLGYFDRPQFIHMQEEYFINAAEMRIRAEQVDRTYRPTEEEIKSYYDEHTDEFLPERPVHVQHIVLEHPDTAQAVKARLDGGADFIELARQYYRGDPEMADVTYDLGFISKHDMPGEVFETAMRLKNGEVSDPIETEWGYHIIRVVDRKEEMPMRQARRIIVGRLNQQHQAEAFERWRRDLLADLIIDIDHEALAEVPILPSEPADSTVNTDTLSIPAP